MRFLIHGSIAFDLLLQSDGSFTDAIDPGVLASLSVSFLAQRLKRHHGGTGANIAWNTALLGHTPVLVGSVGSDGAAYVELLRERGVDVSLVERLDDCATATAIIGTDASEHQIAFFHPGADARGQLPDIADRRDGIHCGIVSARNATLMLKAAAQCRSLGIPYLFDPGQQVHAFGRDEFRRAVVGSRGLVTNEYEWTLASGMLGWKASEVVDACGLLVTTLGERGLTLVTKEESVAIPACKPDHLINPTGAGDAVRAALFVGLASGWSLLQTGRLAAIMGALVCEQEGTMLDQLEQETLQERAMENYGERLPLTA